MMWRTQPDEDDGWERIVPLCREYTLSRIIGPVLEVQIVNILGQPGLENSIPSTLKHETTSYVVITRGTERFVDEIHDHNN